jgi:hypothetical protein
MPNYVYCALISNSIEIRIVRNCCTHISQWLSLHSVSLHLPNPHFLSRIFLPLPQFSSLHSIFWWFPPYSRGPSTLPCGTPDATVTLCVRPRRNSLIHATTLESTLEAAIFVNRRSWGTKSKAFEQLIIIASTLPLLSSNSALSWQTVITRLSHEYPGLSPCWSSNNQSFLSQIFRRFNAVTCSICLQTTEVRLKACTLGPANYHPFVNRNHYVFFFSHLR